MPNNRFALFQGSTTRSNPVPEEAEEDTTITIRAVKKAPASQKTSQAQIEPTQPSTIENQLKVIAAITGKKEPSFDNLVLAITGLINLKKSLLANQNQDRTKCNEAILAVTEKITAMIADQIGKAIREPLSEETLSSSKKTLENILTRGGFTEKDEAAIRANLTNCIADIDFYKTVTEKQTEFETNYQAIIDDQKLSDIDKHLALLEMSLEFIQAIPTVDIMKALSPMIERKLAETSQAFRTELADMTYQEKDTPEQLNQKISYLTKKQTQLTSLRSQLGNQKKVDFKSELFAQTSFESELKNSRRDVDNLFVETNNKKLTLGASLETSPPPISDEQPMSGPNDIDLAEIAVADFDPARTENLNDHVEAIETLRAQFEQLKIIAARHAEKPWTSLSSWIADQTQATQIQAKKTAIENTIAQHYQAVENIATKSIDQPGNSPSPAWGKLAEVLAREEIKSTRFTWSTAQQSQAKRCNDYANFITQFSPALANVQQFSHTLDHDPLVVAGDYEQRKQDINTVLTHLIALSAAPDSKPIKDAIKKAQYEFEMALAQDLRTLDTNFKYSNKELNDLQIATQSLPSCQRIIQQQINYKLSKTEESQRESFQALLKGIQNRRAPITDIDSLYQTWLTRSEAHSKALSDFQRDNSFEKTQQDQLYSAITNKISQIPSLSALMRSKPPVDATLLKSASEKVDALTTYFKQLPKKEADSPTEVADRVMAWLDTTYRTKILILSNEPTLAKLLVDIRQLKAPSKDNTLSNLSDHLVVLETISTYQQSLNDLEKKVSPVGFQRAQEALNAKKVAYETAVLNLNLDNSLNDWLYQHIVAEFNNLLDDTDTLDSSSDTDTSDRLSDTDILDSSSDTDTLDSSSDTDILDSSSDTDILDSSSDTDTLDSSSDTDILDSLVDKPKKYLAEFVTNYRTKFSPLEISFSEKVSKKITENIGKLESYPAQIRDLPITYLTNLLDRKLRQVIASPDKETLDTLLKLRQMAVQYKINNPLLTNSISYYTIQDVITGTAAIYSASHHPHLLVDVTSDISFIHQGTKGTPEEDPALKKLKEHVINFKPLVDAIKSNLPKYDEKDLQELFNYLSDTKNSGELQQALLPAVRAQLIKQLEAEQVLMIDNLADALIKQQPFLIDYARSPWKALSQYTTSLASLDPKLAEKNLQLLTKPIDQLVNNLSKTDAVEITRHIEEIAKLETSKELMPTKQKWLGKLSTLLQNVENKTAQPKLAEIQAELKTLSKTPFTDLAATQLDGIVGQITRLKALQDRCANLLETIGPSNKLRTQIEVEQRNITKQLALRTNFLNNKEVPKKVDPIKFQYIDMIAERLKSEYDSDNSFEFDEIETLVTLDASKMTKTIENHFLHEASQQQMIVADIQNRLLVKIFANLREKLDKITVANDIPNPASAYADIQQNLDKWKTKSGDFPADEAYIKNTLTRLQITIDLKIALAWKKTIDSQIATFQDPTVIASKIAGIRVLRERYEDHPQARDIYISLDNKLQAKQQELAAQASAPSAPVPKTGYFPSFILFNRQEKKAPKTTAEEFAMITGNEKMTKQIKQAKGAYPTASASLDAQVSSLDPEQQKEIKRLQSQWFKATDDQKPSKLEIAAAITKLIPSTPENINKWLTSIQKYRMATSQATDGHVIHDKDGNLSEIKHAAKLGTKIEDFIQLLIHTLTPPAEGSDGFDPEQEVELSISISQSYLKTIKEYPGDIKLIIDIKQQLETNNPPSNVATIKTKFSDLTERKNELVTSQAVTATHHHQRS